MRLEAYSFVGFSGRGVGWELRLGAEAQECLLSHRILSSEPEHRKNRLVTMGYEIPWAWVSDAQAARGFRCFTSKPSPFFQIRGNPRSARVSKLRGPEMNVCQRSTINPPERHFQSETPSILKQLARLSCFPAIPD